ncbi:MAG: hypothetical protein OXD01_06810 [Gammaproteobacteria bacterium]|nr:hypothetical protein [Gammaproteobacteria bacterium]
MLTRPKKLKQQIDPDNLDSGTANAPQFTALHQAEVRALLRARIRLMICLSTLPVYVIAVWALLNNQREITELMFITMALWSCFAIDMVRRRCPACHKHFFVKSIIMNLWTRRCVHCGFSDNTIPRSELKSKLRF